MSSVFEPSLQRISALREPLPQEGAGGMAGAAGTAGTGAGAGTAAVLGAGRTPGTGGTGITPGTSARASGSAAGTPEARMGSKGGRGLIGRDVGAGGWGGT